MSKVTTHTITKGDTRTPIARTLQQTNATGTYEAVDVTDLTVTFKMVDKDGTAVVSNAAATKVDAAAGKVQYDFQEADVDTVGVYFGWFIVTESGETDHFPADGRTMRIEIKEAG